VPQVRRSVRDRPRDQVAILPDTPKIGSPGGVTVLYAHEALLLIGHGSVRYPEAGVAMLRHAEALRDTARFAQVEVAVLNGAPTVADALARITARGVRVVPFFMEDGYFTRVAVPRALHKRHVHLCPPVGVHDGMAGLIERHARDGCEALGVPSRSAAVLVVGHGSARSPGRALALHRHASRVAATGLFARVETACLEEPPLVADVLHGLRAHAVVVIGFFGNRGGHVRDDVPRLVAAEQAARLQDAGGAGLPVRLHGSVTDDPMMVQIILDQAAGDQADGDQATGEHPGGD
jgi:sirohydrochlorin cobaltochelatase